ncbi:MAG: ABC transporter substrate-binding protein, partial [Rhodospirillaceae bacterium]|nr:ABC transporter substrate-binding protein [Rhodospirillaceae bacterium]
MRARAPRGPRRIAGVVLVAVSLLVGIQANAETDTLKIGVLATLEGAFKPLGQDALRGHELAMKEYEESNGERPIEAMIESTDGTPESVVAKARLLIEGGASIVIGPLAGIEGIA